MQVETTEQGRNQVKMLRVLGTRWLVFTRGSSVFAPAGWDLKNERKPGEGPPLIYTDSQRGPYPPVPPRTRANHPLSLTRENRAILVSQPVEI